MHPKRDEVFVNQRCQTGIAIRLVFVPLTRPSGRRGAEIYKKRSALFFRGVQCLIGIFDPIYGHKFTSSANYMFDDAFQRIRTYLGIERG